VASPRLLLGFALSLLPIVAVSICDDVKRCGAGPSSCAHPGCLHRGRARHLAAQRYPSVRQTVTIGWLAFPLSVVWLVGTTNAFNIVDGPMDWRRASAHFRCGLCGVFCS